MNVTDTTASATEAIPAASVSDETMVSVLCVDDEKNILTALKRLFRGERFRVLTATSAREGLVILQNDDTIGLILSDLRMPEINGTAFLEAAKSLVPDVTRMILTGNADMNAVVAAINQGGVHRFITKPWDDQELLAAVRDGLQQYRTIQIDRVLTDVVNRHKDELDEWNTNLKARVLQQTAMVRKTRDELHQRDARSRESSDAMVQRFADLLEQRHQRLGRHSRTVAELAVNIADSLTLPSFQREEIRKAALLHDIGLLSVSDRALSRNVGMMRPDELREYRAHPERGEELIRVNDDLREVGIIIRHHHEAFDGSGFPDGLSGDRIPLGARIVSVANAIDTLFAGESGPDARYRVSKKLNSDSSRQYDPICVAAAMGAVMAIPVDPPTRRMKSDHEIGIADLRADMVLSQNVYSGNGMLLLERGTRLDDALLSALRRYHQTHPALRVSVARSEEIPG